MILPGRTPTSISRLIERSFADLGERVLALAVLVAGGLRKSVAPLPHPQHVLRQPGLALDGADVLSEFGNIVVTHRANRRIDRGQSRRVSYPLETLSRTNDQDDARADGRRPASWRAPRRRSSRSALRCPISSAAISSRSAGTDRGAVRAQSRRFGRRCDRSRPTTASVSCRCPRRSTMIASSMRSARSRSFHASATIRRVRPPSEVRASFDALDAPLASYSSAGARSGAPGPLLRPQPSHRWRRLPRLLAQTRRARSRWRLADMPADCPALLRHQFQPLADRRTAIALPVPGQGARRSSTRRAIAATPASTKGSKRSIASTRDAAWSSSDFRPTISAGRSRATNQEIAQFCRLTYGVQFPMFEKSSVTKVSANPLFATLSASTGVAPQWNFYKYVVDRNGQPVAGYRQPHDARRSRARAA